MFLPRLASILPTSILLPLYVYPVVNNPGQVVDQWQPLKDALKGYGGVTFDIIVNPASGPNQPPSPAFDTTYINSIASLRNYPNARLFVYVHTSYGAVLAEKVKSDISQYAATNISFDGIFFDETPKENTTINYYTEISKFARGKGFKNVILNPGAVVNRQFYDIADIIVAQEEYAANFDIATLTTNLEPEYRSRSAILLHDFKGTKTDQDKIVNDVHAAGFGYLTVTTGKKQGDQEWNTISEVWPDLVGSLNTANGPQQSGGAQ